MKDPRKVIIIDPRQGNFRKLIRTITYVDSLGRSAGRREYFFHYMPAVDESVIAQLHADAFIVDPGRGSIQEKLDEAAKLIPMAGGAPVILWTQIPDRLKNLKQLIQSSSVDMLLHKTGSGLMKAAIERAIEQKQMATASNE